MAIIDTDLKNLSNKLQQMSEAAMVAEADLRCSFDWNGNSRVPCVGHPQFDGKVLEIGGWKRKRMVKIKFRQAALPPGDLPAMNETLVYRPADNGIPVTYRIVRTKNFYDVLMELECVDPNSEG